MTYELNLHPLTSVTTVVLIHEFGFPASLCCTHTTRLLSNLSFWLSKAVLHCVVLPVQANIVYLRLHYIEIHSRMKHASRKCQEPHSTQSWLENSTKCSLGHHFLSIFIRNMLRCCPLSYNRQLLGLCSFSNETQSEYSWNPYRTFYRRCQDFRHLLMSWCIYSMYGWGCLYTIYRSFCVLKHKNMSYKELKSSF